MAQVTPEFSRSRSQAEELAEAMQRHLFYSQAKSTSLATEHDHYRSLALAIRDRLLQSWVDTAETYTRAHVRTVAYLPSICSAPTSKTIWSTSACIRLPKRPVQSWTSIFRPCWPRSQSLALAMEA